MANETRLGARAKATRLLGPLGAPHCFLNKAETRAGMAAQNLGRVRLHPAGLPTGREEERPELGACLPSSPAPGGNGATVKTRAQGVSCGLFSAGSHSRFAGERRRPCWSLLGSLSDKPWRVAERGPRGHGPCTFNWGKINCAQETCFFHHEPCRLNTLAL